MLDVVHVREKPHSYDVRGIKLGSRHQLGGEGGRGEGIKNCSQYVCLVLCIIEQKDLRTWIRCEQNSD